MNFDRRSSPVQYRDCMGYRIAENYKFFFKERGIILLRHQWLAKIFLQSRILVKTESDWSDLESRVEIIPIFKTGFRPSLKRKNWTKIGTGTFPRDEIMTPGTVKTRHNPSDKMKEKRTFLSSVFKDDFLRDQINCLWPIRKWLELKLGFNEIDFSKGW